METCGSKMLCGFQSQDKGSLREAADVEGSPRENRKQDKVGASKDRDKSDSLIDNKLASELPSSLSRVKASVYSASDSFS